MHGGVGNRGRIEDQLLNGHNLLAVAEFLQLAQQRFNLLDESIPLAGFQLSKHFLCDGLAVRTVVKAGQRTDNIVSILVTHQPQERAFTSLIQSRQRLDDLAALRLMAKLDTLLHHVARKLVFREGKQLRHHHVDHARPVLLLSILYDVLDDIVSELIRNEVDGAAVELGQDRLTVDFLTVLEHPLYDSTAVRVCSEPTHLPLEGIDDKLHVRRWDSLNGLLDHVVAVLIAHAFQDIILKLLDHRCLLVREDVLQCL